MRKLTVLFASAIIVLSLLSCDKKNLTLSQLPEQAQQFITLHFPGVTASYIEKDGNEYEVNLSNGFSLEFDSSGNWKKVDGHYQALPASFLATLPTTIPAYVTTNFPTNFIVDIEIESVSKNYDVGLDSDLDLLFDSSGTFIRFDQ